MPLPHIIRGKELKAAQSPVLVLYFSMLCKQPDRVRVWARVKVRYGCRGRVCGRDIDRVRVRVRVRMLGPILIIITGSLRGERDQG
jgi:hypothetical protein